MKRIIVCLAVLSLAAFCEMAHAGVYVLTFPEINGNAYSSGFPLPAVAWSTLSLSIPGSETIVGASISGTWGNTSVYNGSTAETRLFVNGLLVSDTMTLLPDPYYNVVPFSYNYTSGNFATLAGSSATLSFIQTSETIVRLSQTTLTITTVPEPGTMALAGVGGFSLWLLRRRK